MTLVEFSEDVIEKVWRKGQEAPPNSPTQWRKDVCGAWMRRTDHGNRDSDYGWEIDHIDPKGGDDLENLRPLQWKNNASKGDGPLTCPVTSDNTHNIEKSNSGDDSTENNEGTE